MATDLRKTKPASPGKYESFVEEQLARARKRIRTLDTVSAGLVFLAGTLAFLLLMVWLDKAFGLSEAFRQIALAGYGIAAAVYLGVALVWPLCRNLNPYFAARQLEQSVGGAKNSVVNWLDLRAEPLPPAIRTAVGLRAAKDLARADLERAISGRRVVWLGGAGAALFFIL